VISKKIVYISVAIILIAWLGYWFNFGYLYDYKISDNPEHWGWLGDFLGGVLNPILTFLTIVLLVSSLTLQRESNTNLKAEIEKNAHFEQIRSFELHFFNMIDSQNLAFNSFKLEFKNGNTIDVNHSSAAVIELEALIVEVKNNGGTFDQIKGAIESFDQNDHIYSVIRTFCIIAKNIEKKLTHNNGFNKKDRLDYYETLINFTDYSLVRLVLISLKYLTYPTLKSLNNEEFNSLILSIGLNDYQNDI